MERRTKQAGVLAEWIEADLKAGALIQCEANASANALGRCVCACEPTSSCRVVSCRVSSGPKIRDTRDSMHIYILCI